MELSKLNTSRPEKECYSTEQLRDSAALLLKERLACFGGSTEEAQTIASLADAFARLSETARLDREDRRDRFTVSSRR